jgi:hypothetical protein
MFAHSLERGLKLALAIDRYRAAAFGQPNHFRDTRRHATHARLGERTPAVQLDQQNFINLAGPMALS